MGTANKERLLNHKRAAHLKEQIEKETSLKELRNYQPEIILLGLYSNFLFNFSLKNPQILKDALERVNLKMSSQEMDSVIDDFLKTIDDNLELEAIMRGLRIAKKAVLLRLTLQDILGISSLEETMKGLSLLSEKIIQRALGFAERLCIKRYGEPQQSDGLSIIAVGKLGAEELNYSSDIDLIGVYDNDRGKTSGVSAPSGVKVNRITNHEFYCRVMEVFNRLLSTPTEDGIVYRVDFRLRPQGQRGPLAIGLRASKEYYESWGRTWERMVMIRARPVAGAVSTGEGFMEIIRDFVWKRAVDYSEIEEIKAMKKKIDSTFLRDDVKRGYGGIREAEFFVQTLQLMFSSRNPGLQTHRMAEAVNALKGMNIIPGEELDSLYRTYLFLRRLEHYLQMKDDLQTHRLPEDEDELNLLGLKMGYSGKEDFLLDLRVRRMGVKSMYNTLLGTEEDVHAEALFLLTGELSDEEIKEFLRLRGLREPERGTRFIRSIAERMVKYSTEKQRKTAQQVLPLMVEECLRTINPDRALLYLENFLASFGLKEPYLLWFLDQMHICRGIIRMFSASSYLSRLFLSDHILLDNLLEESLIRKTRRHMEEQLQRQIAISGEDTSRVIAEFRRFEEFRLGLYFLMDIIRIYDLFRYLSHLAEVSINACLKRVGGEDEIVVVGMGKLGGREMTFGSDLDIIFVSSPEGVKKAEAVVSALTQYTDRGQPYSIDMRLRPDGSKGTLVKSLEGYRDYYLHSAQQWEVQALLRARPLAGPVKGRKDFFMMIKDVLSDWAERFDPEEVRQMRKRIAEEVSRKRGIDIKFSEGGIEEIEFFVQSLQIMSSKRYPSVIVQNTETAIRRLRVFSVLKDERAKRLLDIYRFFRRLETLLRLNEQDTFDLKEDTSAMIASLMGFSSAGELAERTLSFMKEVREMVSEQAF